MTTISAKIVADSVSDQGVRLTTMQLRYPKCVHGEFMTHRVFSRNASSSRAIPVERLIKDVVENSYVPVHWGKNQRGMQAHEECSERIEIPGMTANDVDREKAWLLARDNAVRVARAFSDAGYHKQIVNRLIEPWCHINVVVTATEWSNFFALRDHEDAMPEIRELARVMKVVMSTSEPKVLGHGEWHLPYVRPDEYRNWPQDLIESGDGYSWEECLGNLTKLSVARCARVSYLTQEGKKPSVDEDLALYDRLVSQVPLHASPCEHQATPDELCTVGVFQGEWKEPHLHGNLRGWIQYRKTLPGECQ